jgi:outer membrane lipoprotein LolB
MKRLTLLIIAFCLTGCVSVRQPAAVQLSKKQPFSVRAQHLAKLSHWTISGAVGIVRPGDTESANYQWQQNGKNYRIKLAGALNVGATTIDGGSGWVKVSRANGQHWEGKSPHTLIASSLGWPLPVEQLYYWVRGIEAPLAYSNRKIDSLGHLQSMKQLGWTIHWSRYASVGQYDLPRWIVLQRPGWKIKLLVRQWILTDKK